jgi:hypothetical protein
VLVCRLLRPPLVLILICSLTQAGTYSIPRVRDVETKSGVPVYIGGFVSCRDHTPYEGTAFVQHGKVTMRRVTVKQCGNLNEPATHYFYVSDPSFKGVDEVNFPLAGSGSTLIIHVTVR